MCEPLDITTLVCQSFIYFLFNGWKSLSSGKAEPGDYRMLAWSEVFSSPPLNLFWSFFRGFHSQAEKEYSTFSFYHNLKICSFLIPFTNGFLNKDHKYSLLISISQLY
jgi:hypothetical protein